MPRNLRSRRNHESASGESSRRETAVSTSVPNSIRRHLETDEAFQTLTIDGMRWICPFTARTVEADFKEAAVKYTVEAPFDFKEAAVKYLPIAQHRPWEQHPQPRTVKEMRVVRWRIFLQQNIRSDDKLKLFLNDGRWLNPYSGDWCTNVPIENGKITEQTIDYIARHLARDPRAQKGQMYSKLTSRSLLARKKSSSSATKLSEAASSGRLPAAISSGDSTTNAKPPGRSSSRRAAIKPRLRRDRQSVGIQSSGKRPATPKPQQQQSGSGKPLAAGEDSKIQYLATRSRKRSAKVVWASSTMPCKIP